VLLVPALPVVRAVTGACAVLPPMAAGIIAVLTGLVLVALIAGVAALPAASVAVGASVEQAALAKQSATPATLSRRVPRKLVNGAVMYMVPRGGSGALGGQRRLDRQT
jgi:hypothetical protein